MLFLPGSSPTDDEKYPLNVAPTTMNIYGTPQFREAKNTDYLCYEPLDLQITAYGILQRQLFIIYLCCITRYCLEHKHRVSFIDKIFFEVGPHCFRPENREIELYLENPKFLWRFSMRNYAYFTRSFTDKGNEPWFDAQFKTYNEDDSPIMPYLKPHREFNLINKLFKDGAFHGKFTPYRVSRIHEFMKESLKYYPSEYDAIEIYYSDDFYLHQMSGITKFKEFMEIILTGQNGINPCPLLQARLENLERGKKQKRTHKKELKMKNMELDVNTILCKESAFVENELTKNELTKTSLSFENTFFDDVNSSSLDNAMVFNYIIGENKKRTAKEKPSREIYYTIPKLPEGDIPSTAADFIGEIPANCNPISILSNIRDRNAELVLINNVLYRNTSWVEDAFIGQSIPQLKFYRHCTDTFGDDCKISNFEFYTNELKCRVGWTLPCEKTKKEAFIRNYVETVILPTRNKNFRAFVNMTSNINDQSLSYEKSTCSQKPKSVRFVEEKQSPMDSVFGILNTLTRAESCGNSEKMAASDLQVDSFTKAHDYNEKAQRLQGQIGSKFSEVIPQNLKTNEESIGHDNIHQNYFDPEIDQPMSSLKLDNTTPVSHSNLKRVGSYSNTTPFSNTKIRSNDDNPNSKVIHPRVVSILSDIKSNCDNILVSPASAKWSSCDQSIDISENSVMETIYVGSSCSNGLPIVNNAITTSNNVNPSVKNNIFLPGAPNGATCSNTAETEQYSPEKEFGTINWSTMFVCNSPSLASDSDSDTSKDMVLVLEDFNKQMDENEDKFMSLKDMKRETKFHAIDATSESKKCDFTSVFEKNLSEKDLHDVIKKFEKQMAKNFKLFSKVTSQDSGIGYNTTHCFAEILKDLVRHPQKYSAKCIPFSCDSFEDTEEFKLDVACFLALYHIKHKTIPVESFETYVERTVELQTRSEAHAKFVHQVAKDRHLSEIYFESIHHEQCDFAGGKLTFVDNKYDRGYDKFYRWCKDIKGRNKVL